MRSGRLRGALGGARLQHVERALLDRELDVLHLAVVPLEPLDRGDELVVGLGQQLVHARDRLGVRMPATTSSPWAFCRNSPYSTCSPVEGSRLKQTPVPELSPRLPNTIWQMFAAVPRSSEMSCARR